MQPLSAEEKIKQTGNEWARAFAAGTLFPPFMTQPALERIAWRRVGGFTIRNCTPPSSAFRKSFEDATLQDIAIKGDKAGAKFSNGEAVQLEGDASGPLAGAWFIHKIGGNAGRGFFE